MILALSPAATIASVVGLSVTVFTAAGGIFFRASNAARGEQISDLKDDLTRAKQRHVDDKAELQDQMRDQELKCQKEIAELNGSLKIVRDGLIADIGQRVGREILAAIEGKQSR